MIKSLCSALLPAMLLSAILLLVSDAAAFADTASEIQRIEGLLKRADVNLQSVQSSLAGRTSPPKGSAGKLVARRLQQAFGDLEPAGKLVTALPAGEAGVAEITTRYNDAVKLYQELAAIMNGGKPPEKEGAKKGEVKLGYPHADNFKNSLFTFRHKVEGPANSLTKLHAELLPVEDQLTIDHRTTAQAIATIAEARRQAGFVQAGLAKIPANGEGVAAAKSSLTQVLSSIEGSEKYFAPLNANLIAMIDPAKFPQFDVDRRRLQGLGSDYSQDWVFTDNRARAAELFQQRQAVQDELIRITQVYQRLMQQQTSMGKTIEGIGNGTLQSLQRFDAKIVEQKAVLPASIRADLAEADKLANDAVQNQKALWFTGGIPQRMGWATDKLALLEVIDPTGSRAVEAEFTQLEASLRKRGKALEELIIRENRPPANNYAGPDRKEIIEIAKSGWAVQQPNAKILAILIPAEAWKRQAKWTYSNGTWYFSDKSRIQVRLVVEDHEDPKRAIDRPVNVIKDHEAADTMIGVPMRSFDEELTPREYFLKANVQLN